MSETGNVTFAEYLATRPKPPVTARLTELERRGDVEGLIAMLDDKGLHPTQRIGAVSALQTLGGPRATEALMAVLATTDAKTAEVRIAAAEALATHGETQAVPVLEAAGRNAVSEVERNAAVEALESIEGPEAAEALSRLRHQSVVGTLIAGVIGYGLVSLLIIGVVALITGKSLIDAAGAVLAFIAVIVISGLIITPLWLFYKAGQRNFHKTLHG